MTLALEINDVGLVLARDGELLAEEPGFATVSYTHLTLPTTPYV